MNDFIPLTRCLACDSENLDTILDLKEQPLANSFKITRDAVTPTYPLKLMHCKECGHSQLSGYVNPEVIFTNYDYVSGTSETQISYFRWFANFIDKSLFTFNKQLNGGSDTLNVLDIGCNDGSQLRELRQYICEYGVLSLKNSKLNYAYLNNLHRFTGIDPANNLKDIRKQHEEKINSNISIRYIEDFYENHIFFKKEHLHRFLFNIIICQNAFAHNPNPYKFLKKIESELSYDGLAFLTISQTDMFKNGEFDTIYHEHISFYSVSSMRSLLRRTQLELLDVNFHPIHGGTLIFTIGHRRPFNMEQRQLIDKKEEEHTREQNSSIKLFESNAGIKINKFRDFIKSCKGKVIGYGAPAKGNTFLNAAVPNHYSLCNELEYIIDDNPLKQNKYAPGTGFPIFSSDKLKEEPDDLTIVVLSWNFYDEIYKKVKSLRPNNIDVFVKFFPDFKREH